MKTRIECAVSVRNGPTAGTRRRWGWIYFAGMDGPRGPIKIGWTKDPAQRMRGLRNGNPEPVEILLAFRGCMQEEHALHKHFAARRLRLDGEWFERSNEMLALMAEIRGDSWQAPPRPALSWVIDREVWRAFPVQ